MFISSKVLTVLHLEVLMGASTSALGDAFTSWLLVCKFIRVGPLPTATDKKKSQAEDLENERTPICLSFLTLIFTTSTVLQMNNNMAKALESAMITVVMQLLKIFFRFTYVTSAFCVM